MVANIDSCNNVATSVAATKKAGLQQPGSKNQALSCGAARQLSQVSYAHGFAFTPGLLNSLNVNLLKHRCLGQALNFGHTVSGYSTVASFFTLQSGNCHGYEYLQVVECENRAAILQNISCLLRLISKIFTPMRLAVIDIGSNAVRLQVHEVHAQQHPYKLKKLEYMRFPLRLGTDVFEKGAISTKTATQFTRLMQAFRLLLDVYEVTDYRACATSAMRDSANGRELVEEIDRKYGLHIEIISGKQEAQLLSVAMRPFIAEGHYLHIDVGGGSTELNLYHDGEHQAGESFKLGSVRNKLSGGADWSDIDDWIKTHIKERHKIKAVGTGGNIGKLTELAGQLYGKHKSYPLAQLKKTHAHLQTLTVEQMIYDLNMNPDRADVIVPAGAIYLHVMELSGAREIIAPDAGLKDGLLQQLVEKNLR